MHWISMRIKMSSFQLEPDQIERLTEWIKEQNETVFEKQKELDGPVGDAARRFGNAYYGAIGGAVTYSFTPTGLGTVVKVAHSETGEELDLTDYDW